ncbi:MAG: monovalent cation:proton antiporter-2 (CPA2) family protein [Magnetospiraceae bacterium]
MSELLLSALIYLGAAVIAVPLAKRLGLGSVLGYLVAGVIIGPVIGLVGSETQSIQHFAEFGVVMMLFIVGLELEPRLLWEMRARLLGLGGLQVLVSACAITGAGWLLGAEFRLALAIGLIFSLSSTAIVLQTLNEKGLSKTDGGRSSFSVLLFQDIAVIPMLALIPLLAPAELLAFGMDINVARAADGGHHSGSLVAGLPGWAYAMVVLAAIAVVVLGGHFLSRPLFRFIAESRLREIFTAAALLLVIGIALLMTLVDLSPALGTFLAGVVLANSEFRHELESDIEPFKGLLLGLFFITVGAGIDFGRLIDDFFKIIGLTLGVILVKMTVLYGLAFLFRLAQADRWLFAFALAQAGEFGFVLLSFGLQNYVLSLSMAKTLSLVVALSMLLTPALFILYERYIVPRLTRGEDVPADAIEETGTVVIAGMGRFGQIINRLLMAGGVSTVVLDHEAAMIESLRRFGTKAYFGDATRPDLLEAAGIDHAQVLVIAIDDQDRAVEMVEFVRRTYPHVTIIARAFDVHHLYLLRKAGAHVAVREMFEGSLEVGSEVLRALNLHPFQVHKMVRNFRHHNVAGLDKLYDLWDDEPDLSQNRAYLATAREHGETLSGMMMGDRLFDGDNADREWAPPPKGYTKDLDE